MKKTLLIATLICFGINDVHSQTPQEMIDSFFKIYAQNQPINALEDLYSHAPWLKEKKNSIDDLKTSFDKLKSIVGEYHGQELLNESNVKNTFIIYTYLVKFDSYPIVFVFEFYKPDKEWTVYSFAYNDNFVNDLKNATKQQTFETKK